ncbi:MAG: hypothetical protein IAF94_01010 [Pirellulaceae bacterium]|nr:hypothetical protein [Pirellulaceae bacterium]
MRAGRGGSAKGKDGFFGFTTNNGAGESITSDLGKASVIEGVPITNNSETAAAAARAKDLTVWISKEGGNRGTQVWFAKTGETEYKIALPKGVPGRYVTIGFPVDKREYLYLKVVKILGR